MIRRDDAGAVAVLTLDHGKANALDLELFHALDRVLDEVAASDAVRGVVLTGAGSMFSAGVDLFRVLEGGVAYLGEFVPHFPRVLRKLFLLPKPVVAAINGHAIAGGCVLSSACDHAVAADLELRIGVTELLVGVPFPATAFEVFHHRVGGPQARRLILSGETLGPHAARERGLVDEVVPADELLQHATAVAGQLGNLPAKAFAVTKQQLRQRAIDQVEGSLATCEEEVLRLWMAPETHARIRAFLERTVGKKG
ncbi:MAG: enoyl-CoA hydratase/isomerase family protein [Acidobacteria bacterium]|nr:MAG: enoyl-CoA hydratase/isomerase family protein [Acidobacteriota bacterium]